VSLAGSAEPLAIQPAKNDILAFMVKTLELAMSKAANLSEAAQEQLGREMLERIDALAELRAEIEVGLRELNAGLGEELDIEDIIRRARSDHAGKVASTNTPSR
jgi:hypothetical protein